MLYLEDYLEMIEHLPQELRDRFTEMRELDLQVQNTMDSLEKRVRFFFMNAKKMKQADKDMEYEAIRKSYYKTLEDADEKVQVASQMYDLVSRYLRRLDQETHKFKLELEADHVGITELLEKRSYDMDAPAINSSQKENRYTFPNQRVSHGEPPLKKRRESSASIDPKRKINPSAGVGVDRVLPDLRMALSGHSTSAALCPTPPSASPAMAYTLGHHIGAGGTAIAAAASQAIAATQQMQQGRRTASLKASYEAIHGSGGGGGPGGPGGVAPELSISKELAGAAQTAIAAIQDTHKKNKKKSTVLTAGTPPIASPASVPSPDPSLAIVTAEQRAAESYDPNEPRWCICNEVAFGTMVACDNKGCPHEWYHYPCVGITDKPKGKWYCPHCTAVMKRKNRKTN